jgi:hypothetical protein
MKLYMDNSAELRCSGVQMVHESLKVFGPEVLREAKKQVQMVRESLKVALTQKKSYVDKQCRCFFTSKI